MQTPIIDALESEPLFQQGLKTLLKNKPFDKVLVKAAEELNELATVLLKKVNKPDKISDEDIMEEMADVQMHLNLLQQYFGYAPLNIMTHKKITKFIKSKDLLKYERNGINGN